MALQCHHLSGGDEIVVRVHFDAWGESDLRDPLTSSLGLPVLGLKGLKGKK